MHSLALLPWLNAEGDSLSSQGLAVSKEGRCDVCKKQRLSFLRLASFIQKNGDPLFSRSILLDLVYDRFQC